MNNFFLLRQLCKYKGVEIIGAHACVDYIHMLVSIPPKLSVSSFRVYLKGKSSLMIYDRQANLKYKHGNGHFWAKGYYVSTAALNKYIREQEEEDKITDSMTNKEYEDLFKGC